MKRSVMFLLLAIMFTTIIGCGFFPEQPSTEGAEEPAPDEIGEQEQAGPEPSKEEAVEKAVEEAKAVVAVDNVTAEQNITGIAGDVIETSGSLDLQDDVGLCPHLAEQFECNRYDVRRCDFKKVVGKNDYYPDLISCRSGYEHKGEDAANKYCLIQECRPLEKENIVYAYGGPVIYAEYDYSVESVEGGIMTHYSLLRCGEAYEEFETNFDCTVYKSKIENVWGE